MLKGWKRRQSKTTKTKVKQIEKQLLIPFHWMTLSLSRQYYTVRKRSSEVKISTRDMTKPRFQCKAPHDRHTNGHLCLLFLYPVFA